MEKFAAVVVVILVFLCENMSVLGLLLFKIGFVFDCNVTASEADCSVCMYTTAIETDFYYGVCMDAARIVQWVERPTEKPGAILTWVQVPGTASFSSFFFFSLSQSQLPVQAPLVLR